MIQAMELYIQPKNECMALFIFWRAQYMKKSSPNEGLVGMLLDTKDIIISPKQPFFVMAATRYYKAVVMNYGISHFYCFRKDDIVNDSIIAVPDGCIDILFFCDEKRPYAEICGTVLHPVKTHHKDNVYYFGVRFQPGNVYGCRNKKISFSEFVEQEVPFLEVTGDTELFDQITSSRDFKFQIRVFLNQYLEYRHLMEMDDRNKRLKDFMIKEMMRTAGQIKIQDLADKSGYSYRYMNKVFTDEFGLPPKVFSKLIRFQQLLNNLNEGKDDLGQLALELGYYDQSHMMKDFNQFANTTPGKYLSSLKETDYKKRLLIV